MVSLAELQSIVGGSKPSGGRFPVALTFDDDLSSHHRIVAPLLSERACPATFFLTGATLDGPSSFWWHDLQQLYQRGGEGWAAVSREFASQWGEPRVQLSLGVAAATIEAAPADVRDHVVNRLRVIAAELPTDPGLDAAAVCELRAAGFEIGFHTHGHYQLQSLDDHGLARAMTEGRTRLSELIGAPLTRIAYPYGAADLRVAAAAARTGFQCGYTVGVDLVRPATDPLLTPRADACTSAARLALTMARLVAGGT